MKISVGAALVALGLLAGNNQAEGSQQHAVGLNKLGAGYKRHTAHRGRRAAHSVQLSARQGGSYSGRGTFFEPGLGACGGYNNAGDWIIALNTAQFGNGAGSSWCGQQLTISANGKTATGTVVDACPTCDYGSLDMSPSLFQQFASESAGVVQLSWHVAGQAPKPSTTSTSYSSSSKYTPPPSSTSTSSTPKPTSTSSTSSSSSSATSTSSTTSSADPSATSATHDNLSGLGSIFDGFVQMAQNVQSSSSAPAQPAPAA